jgi:hypothetical protein
MYALECFLALAKELPAFLDIIVRFVVEFLSAM